MLTLYLAGRPLDVSALDLTLSYQNVTGISERSGNYSVSTELPNTPEVERLIGMLFDVQDDYTLAKNYTYRGDVNILDAPPEPFAVRGLVSARLESDGLCVFEGWARIAEVNGRDYNWKYQIELLGDAAPWVQPAGVLKLRDLGPEVICYNTTNVTDENETYCFPFIEYGGFTYNLAIGTPMVDIENIYPALFIRSLVHLGFRRLGFRVRDRFFVGAPAALIIPFTQDKFRTLLGAMESDVAHFNYDELNYCIVSYSGGCSANDMTNTDYFYVTFFDYTDTPGLAAIPSPGLFAPSVTDAYTCGDVNLCFKVDWGVTLNDDVSARDLEITMTLKSSLDGVILTDMQTITNANRGTHNFSPDKVCADISYGAVIFIEYTARVVVSPGFPTTITDPAFSVVLDYHQLTISHSLNKENFLFDLYANLPDMSFLELVGNLTRMFNLVITADRDAKAVTIETYNDYMVTVEEALAGGPKQNFIDWSGILDHATDQRVIFPATRDVQFSYVQDSDDLSVSYRNNNEGASYGDYTYSAGGAESDESIQADRFASTQDTGVTFSGTTFTRAFRIPRLIPEGHAIPAPDVTAWQPRILFFERETTPGQYWLLGSSATTSVQLSFPLCYFAGALGDLTFEALFNAYYRDCVISFTQRKQIEIAVALAAKDIAALEFGRPVWLGNWWAYVQQVIGWYPNHTSLSRVVVRQV